MQWKEQILETFVDVVTRCVLKSGACIFYSELVDQCSRDVLDEKVVCIATGQNKAETQFQRTRHDDLVTVQLGHEDVKCLAWVCLTEV